VSRRYTDADFDVESDQEGMARMLAHYAALSTAAYERLTGSRDLRYGSDPAERLDVFQPAGQSRGVVVFFHGGWWRSGSKEGRAFLAEALLRDGFHYVNVEYPLAPEASLPRIVESAERALAWVAREIGGYGGDPSRLFVTGNSAGGHLAATVSSLESLERSGVPAGSLRGLVGISGLYDLEPLLALEPNGWLRLDAATGAALSPVHRRYPSGLPVLLPWGSREPDGFRDQAALFHDRLAAAGHPVERREVAGEDHLTIIAHLPEFLASLAGAKVENR